MSWSGCSAATIIWWPVSCGWLLTRWAQTRSPTETEPDLTTALTVKGLHRAATALFFSNRVPVGDLQGFERLGKSMYSSVAIASAPVAQLDRASAAEAEGYWF